METPSPPSLLITPRQLAKALGLSTGHVYRLVQQRRICFVRIGGSIRFRSESIERWISGQEVRSVRETLQRAQK